MSEKEYIYKIWDLYRKEYRSSAGYSGATGKSYWAKIGGPKGLITKWSREIVEKQTRGHASQNFDYIKYERENNYYNKLPFFELHKFELTLVEKLTPDVADKIKEAKLEAQRRVLQIQEEKLNRERAEFERLRKKYEHEQN